MLAAHLSKAGSYFVWHHVHALQILMPGGYPAEREAGMRF